MAGLHASGSLDAAQSGAGAFSMGDKIEARHGGGEVYYPGSIGFVHADTQTCDIVYDDGDAESGVPFSLIRKLQAPVPAASASAQASVTFSMGDKIEARHGGGEVFYPGTVGFAHADAMTCDIIYDDGDAESGVPFALIRKAQVPGQTGTTSSSSSSSSSSSGGQQSNKSNSNDNNSSSSGGSTSFAVGTEVEVRGFKGGWKQGSITTVREEGSFDVTLQDGTVEKGVPPSLVRLKGTGTDNGTSTGGSGGSSSKQSSQAAASAVDQVKIATAAAALKLNATTKKEKALKEELEMLLKAYERQTRIVDKNVQKIASLKTKIVELEQIFSGSA